MAELNPILVTELAKRAQVTIKTMQKVMRGRPVRGHAGLRAARVLRLAGQKAPLYDKVLDYIDSTDDAAAAITTEGSR